MRNSFKLSNDKKKELTEEMARKISGEEDGRPFYSHHYIFPQEKISSYLNYLKSKLDLEDPLQYFSMQQWCDIYFLSKKKSNFYNAEIITCSMAIQDDYLIYKLDRDLDFDPVCDYDIYDKYINLPKFNLDKYRAGAQVKKNYKYGIGVILTLDAPYLTVENITEAINNFWDGGEISFRTESKPKHLVNFSLLRKNILSKNINEADFKPIEEITDEELEGFKPNLEKE